MAEGGGEVSAPPGRDRAPIPAKGGEVIYAGVSGVFFRTKFKLRRHLPDRSLGSGRGYAETIRDVHGRRTLHADAREWFPRSGGKEAGVAVRVGGA